MNSSRSRLNPERQTPSMYRTEEDLTVSYLSSSESASIVGRQLYGRS